MVNITIVVYVMYAIVLAEESNNERQPGRRLGIEKSHNANSVALNLNGPNNRVYFT
jgi:hypothetical protein